MSPDSHCDQVMALAGLFQACSLVKQVARRGLADSAPLTASIESVFAIDAENVESVYGSAVGLATGFAVLRKELARSARGRDREVIRYAVSLLHLERKLMKRPQMLNTLRQGIATAASQAQHFSSTHPNVIASLADLYTRTISTLSPRIMVKGEPTILANPDNAARIRALLLAGIRSTVLWRQRGGTRLNLLLGRRRILQTAEDLATTHTG